MSSETETREQKLEALGFYSMRIRELQGELYGLDAEMPDFKPHRTSELLYGPSTLTRRTLLCRVEDLEKRLSKLEEPVKAADDLPTPKNEKCPTCRYYPDGPCFQYDNVVKPCRYREKAVQA